jgi:sulfonate transport system ATP-binding protein
MTDLKALSGAQESPVAGELRCEGLSFSWPDSRENDAPTLQNIDLVAADGEFVSIVGPSGCGKSTLLALLAGLIAPDDGLVLLDGKVLDGPRREIGVVFQDYTLFPWLTAIQNVMFGPRMQGRARGERRTRAQELLDRVGLGSVSGKYPHQLSGGMRQRVAIARVIANDPECVLMDEPLGALDYQTRRDMQSYLGEIRSVFQKTMVLVTHDIEEAILLSDRIYVLSGSPTRISLQKRISLAQPRRIDDAEVLAVRSEIEATLFSGADTNNGR